LVLKKGVKSLLIFSGGIRKKAGTIGTIGTTSFFPSKNLGCYGDGGALFTNDEALAKKIRSIANHGMKVKYHHNDIGVNSRLDTLQAAILNVKLKHLDEFNAARRSVADFYDKTLAGCQSILLPAPKLEIFSASLVVKYEPPEGTVSPSMYIFTLYSLLPGELEVKVAPTPPVAE
jgi:dTDP-4-amino-4,6-dideoxygalactose transaminase